MIADLLYVDWPIAFRLIFSRRFRAMRRYALSEMERTHEFCVPVGRYVFFRDGRIAR